MLQEVEWQHGMDGQGRKDRAPLASQGQRPGARLARAASMLEACCQTAVPRARQLCLDRPVGGPLVPSPRDSKGAVRRVLGKAARGLGRRTVQAPQAAGVEGLTLQIAQSSPEAAWATMPVTPTRIFLSFKNKEQHCLLLERADVLKLLKKILFSGLHHGTDGPREQVVEVSLPQKEVVS